MKKFIFLCFISLLLISCSSGNDDSSGFYYVFLPIESINVPDSFILNETYQIKVSYYRPTNCHTFNDFYYRNFENEYTVAVINTVIDNVNCESLENDLIEVSFNFVPTYSGTCVFKFWQGLDDNDNDLYYEVEVPIVE